MSQAARLSGVMILCLGAGFVGGWSAKTLHGPADTRRLRKMPEVDAAISAESSSRANATATSSSQPPSSPGVETDSDVIDRRPGGADSDAEFEEEDLSHEVVVWISDVLSDAGAYVAGEQEDHLNPRVRVTVSSAQDPDGTFLVQVSDGDGFCWNEVRLRLDPKTNHVDAHVRSGGDSYPQPPHDWSDVSGRIRASSTEWAPGRPIVIEYSLYGLQGGYRVCAHGKVSVSL